MRGLLHLVAAALVAGQSRASTPDWTTVDTDQLKDRLVDSENLLVAFVAPEDEASRSLLPEWHKLTQELPRSVAVDCTKAPAVCRDMDVRSFPAIRLYQAHGQMARYRGPRKASSYVTLDVEEEIRECANIPASRIASFAKRMARPVVTDLSADSPSAFEGVDDIVVIAELRAQDETIFSHFYDVAEEFRDRYTFAVSEATSGSSSVGCRNNLDDVQHTASDLDRVGALEDLIEQCTTPLVLPLTRRNEIIFNKVSPSRSRRLLGTTARKSFHELTCPVNMEIPRSPVYYFSDDEDDRDEYTRMVRPIAKAFHEFLVFATVDTSEYPHMPASFGFNDSRGLCLQTRHNGAVFHYPNSVLAADAIQSFIVAVSEGKLQPWTDKRGAGNNPHDEL
ncbi:hypothetical protein S7711_06899 [Stachybotrys chartarum IBT 7711]|uniref:Protein disulfide-isomerase n=1 Tax=Stachybotrys chartarum (strain CBS 109288 / IBT 7711) TaxID=1280523 RepID=A0A084ANS1_STACB|nr:hypothetical protein S7711_06899 [Stachybotrys chartarum IBT 7711]